MADIVGIDYYPRHALMTVGTKTLYLDGSKSPWQQRRRKQLFAWTHTHEQKLMISEGQAEPWEMVTIPLIQTNSECIVVCRNKSSTTITPACAGLNKKPPCMRTSFGEQSIGCSESNALTQAISRHLLASLKMPDKAQ
jgi:hypothetical protein